MADLADSEFEGMRAYTEVIQDGMLDLIDSGKLTSVSATAFSLSAERAADFNENIEAYKGRILLRTQEMSNHPEAVRRLGVVAINGMVEADIYGNVNSTHVMGSSIINGIGGSGDFARNSYLNFFVSNSLAKGGAISSIVPFASHITTPSTTRRSSSPSRDSRICAASPRWPGRGGSSRTAPIRTTGTGSRTTSSGRSLRTRTGGTRRTFSARPCRGMRGSRRPVTCERSVRPRERRVEAT